MSREKLREAIEQLSTCMVYDPDSTGLKASIDIILAAARAYACERCDDGCILKDESELEPGGSPWKDCPNCAEFRWIADGGEE